MATLVNVHAELTAVGVDTPAGETDYWVTTGLGYAQAVWYVAHPLTTPNEVRTVEVTHVSFTVDSAGNRSINVQVQNNGDTEASYGLFILWTDQIPA